MRMESAFGVKTYRRSKRCAPPSGERSAMGHLALKGCRSLRVRRALLLCACAAIAVVNARAAADPGGNGNGNAFGLNGGNGHGNAFGLSTGPTITPPPPPPPP